MTLHTLSTASLRREIARRERGGSRLSKRRAKLTKALAAIDAELANLGVNAPKRRGRPPARQPGRKAGHPGPGRPKGSKNKRRSKRAKNAMSLLEAIVSGVRVGSTVSPAQAAAAAKAEGYRSSSPNLGMMVANQLAKAPQFKRVGRGQYVLKGGAAKTTKRGRKAKKFVRKVRLPKGSKHKPAAAASPTKAAAA